MAALQTLNRFVDFVTGPLSSSKSKNTILRQVLPGLSTALGKIILGDWKAGTQIKTLSLEIFTKAVVSVLQDSNFTFKNSTSSPNPPPKADDENLEVFRAFINGNVKSSVNFVNSTPERPPTSFSTTNPADDQWLQTAANQLYKLISMVFPSSYSTTSPNFSGITYIPPKNPFRLCLVKSSQLMLERCSSTLAIATPVLLETLVLHSDDSDLEIAALAKQALDKIFVQNSSNNMTSDFETMLEDNLHRIMKSLPRIITVASGDADKMIPLRLVAGIASTEPPVDLIDYLCRIYATLRSVSWTNCTSHFRAIFCSSASSARNGRF